MKPRRRDLVVIAVLLAVIGVTLWWATPTDSLLIRWQEHQMVRCAPPDVPPALRQWAAEQVWLCAR